MDHEHADAEQRERTEKDCFSGIDHWMKYRSVAGSCSRTGLFGSLGVWGQKDLGKGMIGVHR